LFATASAPVGSEVVFRVERVLDLWRKEEKEREVEEDGKGEEVGDGKEGGLSEVVERA